VPGSRALTPSSLFDSFASTINGTCSDSAQKSLVRTTDLLNNLLHFLIDIKGVSVIFCRRQTQLRRVFHDSTALLTNARAIVTKRQSVKPHMTAG
jgi:hypothetical protein